MQGFLTIIGDWHFWVLVMTYYGVIAAVGALPTPDEVAKVDGKVSLKYQWFYKFTSVFAGNLRDVFGKKVPGANGQ